MIDISVFNEESLAISKMVDKRFVVFGFPKQITLKSDFNHVIFHVLCEEFGCSFEVIVNFVEFKGFVSRDKHFFFIFFLPCF